MAIQTSIAVPQRFRGTVEVSVSVPGRACGVLPNPIHEHDLCPDSSGDGGTRRDTFSVKSDRHTGDEGRPIFNGTGSAVSKGLVIGELNSRKDDCSC
jgi:hypothetical protein